MEDSTSMSGFDSLSMGSKAFIPSGLSLDSIQTPNSTPPDSLISLGGGGGGGGGGRGRPGKSSVSDSTSTTTVSDEEFYGPAELGSHEPEAVEDPVEVIEKAECIKLGWVKPETKYQTQAKVYAEFKVPESIKEKKRVEFELVRNNASGKLPGNTFLPQGQTLLRRLGDQEGV